MSEVKVGDTFGDWTIISLDYKKNTSHKCYLCRCICGKEKYVDVTNLKRGKSKGCGCARNIEVGNRFSTHHKSKTRLYHVWMSIKARCFNKNDSRYMSYGGRGITMCDEWKNSYEEFEKWALNNGYDDSLESFKCTIDRIDNDGNYEPSNCRWVDNITQCNNRRSNHLLEYNGKTQTIKQWADELHIDQRTILMRVRSGFTIDDVFSTERLKGSRHKKEESIIDGCDSDLCLS